LKTEQIISDYKFLKRASACKFRTIDVVSPSYQGTVNLFWGDFCVAWVNNVAVAQEIKDWLGEETK
jgi:hypothetical protein